ncbi:MAG: hypothetical protein ACYDAY_02080 [Candidatus Dormibacteria bacterium]
MSRLVEIGRLGRAAGVHLIVCTQRPDADVVPGQLKANLGGTVAFRTRNAVNAEILVESDRPARLPHIPGRAIWACDRLEEIQGIHLSSAECDRLLAARWSGSAWDLRAGPPDAGSAHVTPSPQSPQLNLDDPSRRADWENPRG